MIEYLKYFPINVLNKAKRHFRIKKYIKEKTVIPLKQML